MAVSSAIDAKPVFQSRPSSVLATQVVVGKAFTLVSICICNTTSGQVLFRLFHDVNGTTYDEDSALHWDTPIEGNTTVWITARIPINTTGSFAIRSSTPSALNFTGYGAKI